ncbi:MAG: DNA alkylation repair protein [Planctomycetes bacterium]|nr:DNA alkylation repair protein [Planctomycetota bacterium]
MIHAEIVSALAAEADPRAAEAQRRYHKYDGYVSYGISTPRYREIMKGFRARLSELPLDDRLALSRRLLASGVDEEASAAIDVLALSRRELGPEHFDFLDRALDDFRSWGSTDHFSIDVLQPLLSRHPKQTLALLYRWNVSENRWKRRASVAAFVRRVGKSGRFTEDVLALAENLIWDPEDLVQKAVGWALKDNLRSARERVVGYVKELRRRGVPSTITLYAIRDLRGAERDDVLAVRAK